MKSIGIFVGDGSCNANCRHCAGDPLVGGVPNFNLIENTLWNAAKNGAKNLTISSAGEPTLFPDHVTRVLDIVNNNRLKFNNINLYSNGIIIGSDPGFANKYLMQWKQKGLTRIYITVHSIHEKENAKHYGVTEYPYLHTIFSRIKYSGLNVRANILLSKDLTNSSLLFIMACTHLFTIGVDSISAWPIRKLDDTIDIDNLPDEEELDKMEEWVSQSDYNISLIINDDRKAYGSKEKMTLFPNGILSNKWCS